MVMRSVQVGLYCWVLLSGCYGSSGHSHESGGSAGIGGSAGSTSSAGRGGTSSGATGGGGTSSSSSPDLTQACLDACAVQQGCGADLDCASTCTDLDLVYQGECAQAAAQELDCETMLSCDELATYGESPRTHPTCGAAATAFVDACGYSPSTPAECSAFCDKAELCEPTLTVGGCADNCNVTLGALVTVGGAGCADAYLAVYDCFGMLDCAAMSAFLTSATPPSSCNDAALSAGVACQ